MNSRFIQAGIAGLVIVGTAIAADLIVRRHMPASQAAIGLVVFSAAWIASWLLMWQMFGSRGRL